MQRFKQLWLDGPQNQHWRRMMFKAGLLSVMLLALAGCASGRGATANEAQSQMIGMSKEQILRCMGPPHSSYTVGSSTEVWAYNSAPQEGAAPACIVNVMTQDSQVIDIDYRGPAGALMPKDKQCVYAIEKCVK
jgi:outer membrane protein assembly factor BamE (lipoprotein component of BamABCDE complex)